MKVWITKYALTQGIFAIDAEVCESHPEMIEQKIPKSNYGGTYYHGKGRDWHETIDSAIKKAEEMRLKKVSEMRLKKVSTENKLLKKLINMRFEVHDISEVK